MVIPLHPAWLKSPRSWARTSEPSFLAVSRDSPRPWLKRLRMERAIELFRDGSNMNQTADYLVIRIAATFLATSGSTMAWPQNGSQPLQEGKKQPRLRIRPHNFRIWPQKCASRALYYLEN